MSRTAPMIDAAPGGDGVMDDGQIAKVIALAERGVDSNESAQGRQRRKPDVREPKEGERDETPVQVICVVDNRPWTHERALKHKERVTIPRWVATLMEQNGQVVVI